MREELGSRNVSNKTVDMHSPSKISLYLHQKTILSRGLYLVRKLRSNPFQRTLFRLETISLCGDIHQILHKWETCQQFCKSLYMEHACVATDHKTVLYVATWSYMELHIATCIYMQLDVYAWSWTYIHRAIVYTNA